MRLLDAIARTVLAITLGALVVGHGFVVPMLAGERTLLDANLARAITGPVELRIADVIAFGCVLTACVVPRWTDRHVATTLALLGVILAGIDRLLVLPRLHSSWTQVDLVAMRPLDRLQTAETLATQHLWLLAGIGVCMISTSILGELARAGAPPPATSPAASKPMPSITPAPAPTLPDAGSSPAPA